MSSIFAPFLKYRALSVPRASLALLSSALAAQRPEQHLSPRDEQHYAQVTPDSDIGIARVSSFPGGVTCTIRMVKHYPAKRKVPRRCVLAAICFLGYVPS